MFYDQVTGVWRIAGDWLVRSELKNAPTRGDVGSREQWRLSVGFDKILDEGDIFRFYTWIITMDLRFHKHQNCLKY